jgi:hypothetical protein
VVVESIMRPAEGKPPEAFFTAIMRDGVWIIVDRAGEPVPTGRYDALGQPRNHFNDRSDAWACIDRLRHRAGCGGPRPAWRPFAVPVSRPPAPRRERGH